MNADRLLCELRHRGVEVRPCDGGANLLLRPRAKLTPELIECARQLKGELLEHLLAPVPWNGDVAQVLLAATLRKIGLLAENAGEHVCKRLGILLADFGPVIESTFVRKDPEALRVALRDLGRAGEDAVAGRGYDNARPEPSAAPPDAEDEGEDAIDPGIRAQLLSAWAEAEPRGWSSERIFNFSHWPHARDYHRGLASVLRKGDRVVAVDGRAITIEGLSGRCLRFFRDDG